MPDTGRRLVLMAVHAHPDDEATSTGGVLARYAAEGVETVLVTCTDGGCGDGPGGVKPGQPGFDRDEVVAMRDRELRRSAEVLGVTHLEQLGYADSGMMGWDTNKAPDAFWNTPVDEAAARVAALIARYRPDVVITYDDFGFYGHPDHIQAHRVTMDALGRPEAGGSVRKVYYTTVPRSEFAKFMEIFAELGGDPDAENEQIVTEDGSPAPELGLPDDEITTWVDTTAFAAQKYASLEAHASQSENIIFLKIGLDRFTDLMGIETFQRVRDDTGAAVPEDDLFAGLR